MAQSNPVVLDINKSLDQFILAAKKLSTCSSYVTLGRSSRGFSYNTIRSEFFYEVAPHNFEFEEKDYSKHRHMLSCHKKRKLRKIKSQ